MSTDCFVIAGKCVKKFFVYRGQEECLSCISCFLHTTFCWGNKPTNFVFKEKINKSQTRPSFPQEIQVIPDTDIYMKVFFKFYFIFFITNQ